jgi:hypothetical protein
MTIHKLNDLQIILLSAAGRHEAGSLLPLPSAAASDLVRTGKAIAALVRKGLAEEAPVIDHRLAWPDADQNPTGVFITAAGHEAIRLGAGGTSSENSGAESGAAGPSDANGDGFTNSAAQAYQPRATGKTTMVLNLLCRPTGATLAELVAVTGWLPHTTRAALTSLRKKGHAIACSKRGDVTCYTIEAAA